jgi:hypothetical protein
MARNAFYSFHYDADNWRASQVRNMGAIEGNAPVADNDWETVKRGGHSAIERWIADQMSGRSCIVLLIGAGTAGRKWITHEIVTGWNAKKGIVGIHVHNLLDADRKQSSKGADPFSGITVGSERKPMSSVVRTYDPPFWQSADAYGHIKTNLSAWVEEAIRIRDSS